MGQNPPIPSEKLNYKSFQCSGTIVVCFVLLWKNATESPIPRCRHWERTFLLDRAMGRTPEGKGENKRKEAEFIFIRKLLQRQPLYSLNYSVNLHIRAGPLDPSHLLKDLPPNTLQWGLSFQHTN